MTRLFEFSLDRSGLDGVRFLLSRTRLPCNGDVESPFLDGISGLRRHPANGSFASTFFQAAQDAEILVVIRNPDLVLDQDLPDRIVAALASLPAAGDWAIAGAGGLGLGDRRHIALYASAHPVIPENAGLQPLIDVMPDLYIVNATWVKALDKSEIAKADLALEIALTVQGYLDGRVSVFAPDLAAGIDGDLMARDLGRVTAELRRAFAGRLADQDLGTLSGPIRLDGTQDAVPLGDPMVPTVPTVPTIDLAERVAIAIADRASVPSLSIVTRTRFQRPHLLRRMLASISRARTEEMPLEIVLSTDADPSVAEAAFEDLRADFVNLRLRLKINPPSGHSRVTNLQGGVQIASGDYVLLLDDDDYLDLFAFDTMRAAFFAGNRPMIALTSDVHEETWEETPSGRWVLSHSARMKTYPARGWRNMFSGTNRMPICGMAIPRERLRARLRAFPMTHDLSEDYALFLLLLTDPDLPAIHECDEAAVHISLRGSENSVLMPDRRPWVQDIARYLADLTRTPGIAGAGQWALLTLPEPGPAPPPASGVDALQDQLRRRDQEIRLLRQELQRLRESGSFARERAA